MAQENTIPFEDYLKEHPEVQDIVGRVRRIHALPRSERNTPANKLEMIPNYLGSGLDKDAFRVGDHVVKLVHPHPERPMHAQLKPLKRAIGITGVEQMVSVSMRAGIFVTEYVDGVVPPKLTAEALSERITPESIRAFKETVAAMQERGVYVDSPSNIFVTDGVQPRFIAIDPLDASSGATNDSYEIIKGISQWELSGDGSTSILRSHEDMAFIQAAFARAR